MNRTIDAGWLLKVRENVASANRSGALAWDSVRFLLGAVIDLVEAFENQRYRDRCPFRAGYDVCVYVEGHGGAHILQDFDYPSSGHRSREYEYKT